MCELHGGEKTELSMGGPKSKKKANPVRRTEKCNKKETKGNSGNQF